MRSAPHVGSYIRMHGSQLVVVLSGEVMEFLEMGSLAEGSTSLWAGFFAGGSHYGRALLEAVCHYGRALLEAVRHYGRALLEAVRHYGRALLEAVRHYGRALLEAVRRRGRAFENLWSHPISTLLFPRVLTKYDQPVSCPSCLWLRHSHHLNSL